MATCRIGNMRLNKHKLPLEGNVPDVVVDYDPNPLLDYVMRHLGVENDLQLSRHIGISPPVISKVRHGKIPLGSALLVRLHETSGVPTRVLRALTGDLSPLYIPFRFIAPKGLKPPSRRRFDVVPEDIESSSAERSGTGR